MTTSPLPALTTLGEGSGLHRCPNTLAEGAAVYCGCAANVCEVMPATNGADSMAYVADAGGRCPCGERRCRPGCAARDPFGLWDLLGETLTRVEHLIGLREWRMASDALRAAHRYVGWLRQDRPEGGR